MGLFRKKETKSNEELKQDLAKIWNERHHAKLTPTEEIRRRRLEEVNQKAETEWYFRLLEDVKKIQKAGGIPSSNPNLDLTIQLNRIIELLEKISRTTSNSESRLNDINDKTRDKYGDSHR